MHHVLGSAVPSVQDDRLIDIEEVSNIVGMKRSAIYNRVRSGEMPSPIRLSGRCTRWKLSQVHAWIESKVQAQSAA